MRPKPGAGFDPQDAAHGIVDTRHADFPLLTCLIVLPYSARQSSGTMTRSMPALMACGQELLVHPGTLAVAVPVANDKPVEAHTLL